MSSVASFFLSRVDGVVDRQLDALDPQAHPLAPQLRGQAALANARLAHRACLEVWGSERWSRLQRAGAQQQRLLWASTGVKDTRYPPDRYLSGLVLRDTVNTMPPATLRVAADTVPATPDDAGAAEGRPDPGQVAAGLADLGIDLAATARELEDTAVRLFQNSYAQLVDTVSGALQAAGADVQADGTSRPVGGGQRPAAPAA